jgi:hypothetical protein
MNYVSSVAERAMVTVDRLINQAMTYAWTSSLQHRCPGKEFTKEFAPRWKALPEGEENYGGGDFCSPEADASTDDDQPLA